MSPTRFATLTGPAHLIVLDDQDEALFAWSQNNSNQWLGHSDTASEGNFIAVTDQQLVFTGNASGNNASKNCLMTKDSARQTSADGCTSGHPYLCECDGNAAASRRTGERAHPAVTPSWPFSELT